MALKDDLINSAIQKVKNVASNIGNKFTDQEGWFRGGQFTPGQQVKSIQQQSPVQSFGPLVLPNFQNQQVQQAYKPIVPYAKKFGEGFGESSTYGLIDIPNAPSQNLGQKIAYGAGFVGGMINPLNPLNKVMGALNIGGKAVSKFAPQIAGKLSGKIIGGIGSEALQTGAYTGVQYLAGKAGLREDTPITPQSVASNLAFGVGARGVLSQQGMSAISRGVKNLFGGEAYVSDFQNVNNALQRLKTMSSKQDFSGEEMNKLVADAKMYSRKLGLDTLRNFNKLNIQKQYDLIANKLENMIRSGDQPIMGIKDQSKGVIPEVKMEYGNEVNSRLKNALETYRKTGSIEEAKNNFFQSLEDDGIYYTNNARQFNNKIDSAISKYFPKGVPEVKTNIEVPKGKIKVRGLTQSVQEAPNVVKQVKAIVGSSYTPKSNQKLMGEARALLESGATIDFKNTQNLDTKVAATIKEAINQQVRGNHEAAANLFNNLSEHGTELGRSVQAFSLLKNMSPEAIALSAAGKIKKYNATATRKIPELTGDQVKMISEKVQALDLLKGREKNIALNELNNLINDFIPSSLGDKAIAVWKAGLLTSLRTHERNFVGNAIHGLTETLKDIPASLADIALSTKTGKRTTTFTTKGISEFGSKSTREQMADIISKGYDPSEQINKFDHKTITWGKGKVEQLLKKYTDVVFRTLGASDKPFYNSALSRSLYNQAGATAINAGKRGDTSFIEQLVKNPTEEMIKVAISDANVATFKDKNMASNLASTLKRVMGQNELTKVLGEITIPFTGVPSSILGQIQAYSPIGLIKGIYRAGQVVVNNLPELQRQAAQEIGRGVIGTGIFGLGSYLMSKGLITGQPKDATEARQWELENKPRNSIMIGGKWRSLNSIGPESVVFLAGAKLNEEMGNPEGSLANYGVTLGKDYLDQSFVQGLQGPVNAITDPNRYAKSYLGQLASSPIPNIVKDVSRAVDPSSREANTVLDYVKSSIPGVRNTLTEKRDALGNVIPQEPTGISAFVDLFNSKTPISNTVVNELSRLNSVGENATPSKLTTSQTVLKQKIKLTFDQLNTLEKGVGEALRPQLESLITSNGYQSLDDEQKSEAIDKLVTKVRTQYKNLGGVSSPTATGIIGNESITYPTETGIGTLDLNKLDVIAKLPDTNRYQKAIKESEQFSKAASILDNQFLTNEQKDTAIARLGIDPDKASYYQVANDNTNKKTMFVLDALDRVKSNGGNPLELLTQQRQQINGQMIASNGVLDNLVDEGVISYAQAKELKKYKMENGSLVKMGKARVSKSKKIKLPKLKKLKVPKMKKIKLKKFKPVKLKPLAKLKVKRVANRSS